MDCIYIALSQTQWPLKALNIFSHIHSLTAVSAIQGRLHPARQEQHGVRCLELMTELKKENVVLVYPWTYRKPLTPLTLISFCTNCITIVAREWFRTYLYVREQC